MHAALLAHVLAEHHHARIHLELAAQRATHGFGESEHLAVLARDLVATEIATDRARQAAERFGRAIGVVGAHMLGDPRGVGHRARTSGRERVLHVARDFHFERAPVGRAQECRHEVRAQSRQRIARLIDGDLGVAAVALLIVGTRVVREARHREMHQRGASAAAHVGDALLEEHRRCGWIGAVTIADEQVGERREVLRDIAARRLHLPLHRNAEVVVLYIEEHRELERRRHGERRPETVGRDRGIAAEGDADRASPTLVVERIAMVGDRLRPARRGRVLRSHVAGHRQHDRTVAIGQVADHADVAPVGEAARSAERGA